MGRHATVIGAGIGGLAATIALRRSGWDVDVFDRADGPSRNGTALGMWPAAMEALDALGVGDRVRHRSSYARGASILAPDGRLLARIPESRGAHLISRERLMSTLLEELPGGFVHWAHPLSTDGNLPASDLIVGADGVHSTVRSRYWGPSTPRPLGTVAFRGVVARPVHSVSETWGTGALFGITPTGDGRTNWFAGVRRSEAGAVERPPAGILRDLFGTWHHGVRDVLDDLDDQGIDRRELFDVALPHPFVRGGVALVGDAAHAMAPNLGRGGCEALVDAVTLARELRSEPSIEPALRGYDRIRRRSTRRLVAAARMLNRVATAERGVPLRDNALSLLSTRG